MKIDNLVVFFVVFGLLIAGSFALGNYDMVTPEMAHSQAALTVGTGLTAGISTALNWMFKLALGSVCAGFGVAAFNEVRKGYRLWKRQANAGRWQGGPNAGYQRQAQSPRATMTDKLLLMLAAGGNSYSGLDRLGLGGGRQMDGGRHKASPYDDDDDLNIEL